MIGHELPLRTGHDMVRVVRALGQHRYVAGRLHLVHAFAVEAACESDDQAVQGALAEAKAWAAGVLADPAVDRASKDERLFRRATDAELVAVLSAFWVPGEGRERASRRLAERLASIDVAPPDPSALPFDESLEEDLFPVLVDAGWELLALAELDPERHRGAIAAFAEAGEAGDEELSFEIARFEEENAGDREAALEELPAMGAVELLAAIDAEGNARAPFVVWTSGHDVYVDYVLRGVRRAAKLE